MIFVTLISSIKLRFSLNEHKLKIVYKILNMPQVRKRVMLSRSADVIKYSRMCAFGHDNDDYMMYFELLEQYSNE